jgi:hypothetical protein
MIEICLGLFWLFCGIVYMSLAIHSFIIGEYHKELIIIVLFGIIYFIASFCLLFNNESKTIDIFYNSIVENELYDSN